MQTWQASLFADPYAALCADVGPPAKADWTQYRLSQPQKIAVVSALGVTYGTAGIYLVDLRSTVSFGWYAYAPLSWAALSAAYGLAGWLRLIIWLTLIGLWALAPIRVLRPSAEESPG